MNPRIEKAIAENADKIEQEVIETIRFILENEGIEGSEKNIKTAVEQFLKGEVNAKKIQ